MVTRARTPRRPPVRRRVRASGVSIYVVSEDLTSVEADIRRLNRLITPIKSGRLRRSLVIRKLGRTLIARWTVFYAVYVNARLGFVSRIASELG